MEQDPVPAMQWPAKSQQQTAVQQREEPAFPLLTPTVNVRNWFAAGFERSAPEFG
jgi:hypothetical protein